MTRKEFETIRPALLNDSWIPLDKWHKIYKDSMCDIPYEHVQELQPIKGTWKPMAGLVYYPGCIYRVNPDWKGPADVVKTASPVYIDSKPFRRSDGSWAAHDGTSVIWSLFSLHIGSGGCIGFIYGNTVHHTLQIKGFSTVNNGASELSGYTLIIPDAVRFANP